MINKLVKTFEEENNFNNAIVALTMDVCEVVFVYHHEVSKRKIEDCKSVISKYKNIKIEFKKIDEQDIDDIIDSSCVIDMSAAKYLSFALFEKALKKNIDVVYYDEEEEVIKKYNDHSILYKNIFKLTIEDIVKLGGGKILSRLHEAVKDKETIELINRSVESEKGSYSSFINYVNRVNSLIKNSEYSDNIYHLNSETINKITHDDQYRKFNEIGLFEIKGNDLVFKNNEIRKIFTVSGAFLENYIYHKLNDSKKFDEVMMSAKIEFNDEQWKYPVTCEIDCLVLKNNRMLFTSIKSNKVDVDDLNEIKVHDVMFGNKQSKPVICLHSNLSENKPSIYAKAEELKIYVVDEDSFKDKIIVEKFLSIVEQTYKYDKLR